MKAIVYIIALAYLCLPVSGFASGVRTELYAVLESDAPSDEKLGLLNKVGRGPNYAWALAESAAILYKEQRWTEFFGVSYFVKSVFPNSESMVRVELLETLALLRHCRWDDAKTSLSLSGKAAGNSVWKAEQTALMELLGVAPKSASEMSANQENNRKELARLWPVKSLPLEKLNPYKLRRRVQARCSLTDEGKEAPGASK